MLVGNKTDLITNPSMLRKLAERKKEVVIAGGIDP